MDADEPSLLTLSLSALLVLTPVPADFVEGDYPAISSEPAVAIAQVHAVLELPPAPAALVPELHAFFVLVSERAATGEIPPRWAAYLYTNYYRDLARDRPDGLPRRGERELRADLEASIEFFYIRKRPDVQPAPFGVWIWQAMPLPLEKMQ